MAFRDDKVALAARAQSLEALLEEAREDLAEAEHDAAATAELRERIARLEGEAEGLRRGIDPKATPSFVHVGVAGVVGGLIGALVVFALGDPSPDIREEPPSHEPTPREPAPREPAPREPAPREPAPAPPSESPPLPALAPSGDVIEWAAEVITADGLELGPGTACTLAGSAAALRFHEQRRPTRLVLRCGDELLFDLAAPSIGAAPLDAVELVEQALVFGEPRFVYQLVAHDHGLGGGRAQLEVDTQAGTLTTWREEEPSFRVLLTVEAESTPRGGRALHGANGPLPRVPEAIERDGTVVTSLGAAPAMTDEGCHFELTPLDDDPSTYDHFNCAGELRCGGRALYRRGEARCRVLGGETVDLRDSRFSSRDRTPAMVVDLRASTIEVSDDTSEGAWSLRVRLESR